MKQRETMVISQQHCLSFGNKWFEWKSKPMALGGKYPMGNVLLSLEILCAGAPISKVLLVFNHMSMSAYSASTLFYQKIFLFPVVISDWERYQEKLISQVKG